MHSGSSSNRPRIVASISALVSISAASGCSPRAVSDIDREQPPVASPQPAIAQPSQDPVRTTFAVGEEDAGNAQPTDQFATTFAIGEEDGRGPTPVEADGRIGASPGPYDPSTAAPIGEVAGEYERIYIPEPGATTTFAIGEEG